MVQVNAPMANIAEQIAMTRKITPKVSDMAFSFHREVGFTRLDKGKKNLFGYEQRPLSPKRQ
jgi:hypothetical protein